MYGQLYHRTISRELPEPQRDPRGAGGGPQARVAAGRGDVGRRRGWREGMGSARAAGRQVLGASSGGADEMTETRACGKRTRPELQGAKPVRPVRGPATRDEVPRKVGQRWQHLHAMRDFGFLDAKEGPWRQDSRAMHPESPDCAWKWTHKARILPF